MAPVVKALEEDNELTSIVCVTAQHREMLDQVLELFMIKPDYDLNVMQPGQTLSLLTERILAKLDEVLLSCEPDMILVHGDTTTTFVASLCAFYHKIPIGHVEAGLRTGDLHSPWPEEANRKLTGAISTLHFAPTKQSKINLLKENIPDDKITVTGNTVIDSLIHVIKSIESQHKLKNDILKTLPLNLVNKRIVLITAHRRENFGDGFNNICQAILELSNSNQNVDFIFPVHLNPKVRQPVQDVLSNLHNVKLIDPLDYLPFVYLMSKCHIVLTDSGGIQEEAPSLGKPVLVMRDTTERPEAVDAGTVLLVGTNKEKIIEEVQKLLNNDDLYEKMSVAHNPYGDGLASGRIINEIKNHYR
tara:strand:- start:7613 stop:8692 length:1080 start_codon:yes stop_codon:yes gene_type:complete